MTKLQAAFAVLAMTSIPFGSPVAFAQTGSVSGNAAGNVTVIPGSDATTVTNWYKQNIYDTANTKIGEVEDVLVSNDGKVTALLVSVGGFLGIGEKVVAVAFPSVKQSLKDGKSYLTMNASKDALKTAPGYAYDKATLTWKPS